MKLVAIQKNLLILLTIDYQSFILNNFKSITDYKSDLLDTLRPLEDFLEVYVVSNYRRRHIWNWGGGGGGLGTPI